MKFLKILTIGSIVATSCGFGMMTNTADAALIGQLDDFQSGTTLGWAGGSAPQHQADGGPTGAGDGYLQLTAQGFHLGTMNLAQWTGDYLTAGIDAIQIDARHFAPVTDSVALRLVLFGPGGTFSTIDPIPISTDGWNTYQFSLAEANMVHLGGGPGMFNDTLGSVTRLLIRNDLADPPALPGNHVEHINATFGIDNITAIGQPIPEPTGLGLLAIGLVATSVLPVRVARPSKCRR